MRRFVIAFAAASLVATAATAAPAGVATRYKCGPKALDIYFWPHGHPAIPQLEFPAYKPPHLEVYSAHSTSGQIAYLAKNYGAGAKICVALPDSAAVVGTSKSTRKQQKFRCTLPKAPQLRFVKVPGNVKMQIVSGRAKKADLETLITGTGGKVKYSTRCKRIGLYQ